MLAEITNHLWQSTLTAIALAALAATLRAHGAHIRYWIWWAASVKFLVPFSLLAALGGSLATRSVPVYVFGAWSETFGRLARPMSETASWTPVTEALLAVWALGFVAVVVTWLMRALGLRAVLRAARPYPAPTTLVGVLDVRAVTAPIEPALIGIFRPVLLLPQGIAEHLNRAQLDAVLAHELSHWKRRDNLTAAIHMLVQAVFWFHPIVWWIGGRLVEERERACDEAVVQAGHDSRSYAEAILNVCESYIASKLTCAAGISGANLKRRVIEIAQRRAISALPMRKKTLLGAVACLALLLPIVFGAVSGTAAAQNDRDVIPIARVPPDYPPDALRLGLEGWVQLRFTVAVDGSTKDVVAVASSSPEFEASSVAALLQWRYVPRIDRGRFVERRGVETIIRYQLERDRP
jgi:bla regulator protein BlaR1